MCFRKSWIKVTTVGRRYLGGSLGTQKFKDLYIKTKVNEWISQLELLAKIAVIEPQSAYCAFTAGFKHKVTYTMRTIPDICQHLQKLDQYVEKVFIPVLVDRHIPSNVERKLLFLPVKLGSMGIAKTEYQNSRNITESLTKLHLEQTTE